MQDSFKGPTFEGRSVGELNVPNRLVKKKAKAHLYDT